MSSIITTIFLHDNVGKICPTICRSICEDDDFCANTDLLRVDCDSDDSSCSSENMLSYDSERQIYQTLLIHSNVIRKLDDVSRFHSHTKTSPLVQSISHPLSHDFNSFSVPVNDCGENDTIHVRENNRKLVHTASSSSFIDLNNSICSSRSTYADSKNLILKIEKSTLQDSTSISYASSTLKSVSSLSNISLASSRRSVPAAVIFANQCLERSKQRSTSPLVPPSSLLNKSYGASYYSDFSLKSSSISSPLITYKPSLIDPSSVHSHTLMPSSSFAPYKTPATVQATEKLLNDVSQPSSRVQQLKRKLRVMEIKYYRQKCVRSLKNSMVHYSKLNCTGEIKHNYIGNSICSELCSVSNHVRRRRVVSTARAISSTAIETLCFNLILSMVYMFLVLYKDSLSNVIIPLMARGIIINNNKL